MALKLIPWPGSEPPATGGRDPDDVGIIFTVHPLKPVAEGSPSKEAEEDSPKTAVEATLPWRRNSSFGSEDDTRENGQEDRSSMVLRQEEFPAWITNNLPNYASPTNTLLEALDRDKSSGPRLTPAYEIFTVTGASASPVNQTTRGSAGLDKRTGQSTSSDSRSDLTPERQRKGNRQKQDKLVPPSRSLTPSSYRSTSSVGNRSAAGSPSPSSYRRTPDSTAINLAFVDDNDLPVTKLWPHRQAN